MLNTRSQWRRVLLTGTCFLSVLAVPAAEIYRWTDGNGQVHYGQRPPPGGADRIELPESGTVVPEEDAGIVQRRERQGRLLDAFEYERAQKKARKALEDEQREEDAARCARLQRYWRQLSYPGPLYLTGADGGRDYLSDEQRESEKTRVRASYIRACGKEP